MKRTLKVALLLAVAVLGGYNIHQSNKQTGDTLELDLANVEALAASEKGCLNGTQNWGYCFVEGTRYKCENYWIWNCVTAIN